MYEIVRSKLVLKIFIFCYQSCLEVTTNAKKQTSPFTLFTNNFPQPDKHVVVYILLFKYAYCIKWEYLHDVKHAVCKIEGFVIWDLYNLCVCRFNTRQLSKAVALSNPIQGIEKEGKPQQRMVVKKIPIKILPKMTNCSFKAST